MKIFEVEKKPNDSPMSWADVNAMFADNPKKLEFIALAYSDPKTGKDWGAAIDVGALNYARYMDAQQDKLRNKGTGNKTTRSPMTRKEKEPIDKTADTSDRIGKSGKKWGNQYYKDAPKSKSQLYKDLKDKLGKAIGDVTQKDARDLGSDIAKDTISAFDKLTKLGKKP